MRYRTVQRRHLRSGSLRPRAPLAVASALALVLAGSGLAGAVPAALAAGPSLTVTPTTTALGTKPVHLTVVLDNPTTATLVGVQLTAIVNGDASLALTATPDLAQRQQVPAEGAFAWDVAVATTGRRSAATVVFLVRFDLQAPASAQPGGTPPPATPQVLQAAVDLTATPLAAAVEVKAGSGELSEQAAQVVAVLVTNNSNEPVTVVVTPRDVATPGDDAAVTFLPETSDPRVLQPRDQVAVPFMLTAGDRVVPGDRTLVFEVDLKGEAGDQTVAVTHTVKLGVLGDAAVSTLLGVPAFFMIPGVIVLVVWQLITGLFGALLNTRRGLTAFDKEFWVIAIAISLLFGVVYRLVTPRDYLFSGTGYGTRDVVAVWLLGFAVPVFAYGLGRLAQLLFRRNEINVRDRPVNLLRKMAGKSVTADRPSVEVAGVHGFLLQDSLDGGGYWVAPPIRVDWLPTRTVDTETAVRAELKANGNLSALAEALQQAERKGEALVRYDWRGTLTGPQKVAPDKIAIADRDILVGEGSR